MITVSVKHHLDDTLLAEWHALWKSVENGHFFNTPEWFLTYCHSFSISSYCIIVVEEDNKLMAILPLIYEKVFFIPVLVSPGGKFLDKSTLLLRKNDKAILDVLLKKLMTLGSFYLRELPEDIAKEFASLSNLLTKQESSVNPYISLSEDPFQFLAKDDKSKIFNRAKKNEEHLAFKSYHGEMKGLEIAFALDQKSYKSQKGKAALSSDRERNFYKELLKTNKEHVVINVLSYDDVPIAFDLGYVYKKTYQAALTGYDGNYRPLSPGKILLYFILRHFKSDGYTLFDFSRGTSVLKKEFTPLSSLHYDVFYAKHAWVKQWWKLTRYIYFFILENKLIYNSYLFFKKLLTYF